MKKASDFTSDAFLFEKKYVFLYLENYRKIA